MTRLARIFSITTIAAFSTLGIGCSDDAESTGTGGSAGSGATAGTGGSGNAGTGGTGNAGTGGTAGAAAQNIYDTAKGAGFDTLIAAVDAADLADTVKTGGPFTVFAPTDEAFAKLPAGTLDDLLKPENKAKLTAILTYHVVAGEVPASQVVTLTEATTVNGAKVKITVAGTSVKLNDTINVTSTDVEASNGIIHVIDGVLLPPTP